MNGRDIRQSLDRGLVLCKEIEAIYRRKRRRDLILEAVDRIVPFAVLGAVLLGLFLLRP